MENKTIAKLEEMKNALDNSDSPIVQSVRIEDPIAAVETSLADFVHHSFTRLEESREFERDLEDTLRTRLPEANFDQVTALYGIVKASDVSMTDKLLAPFTASSASHFAEGSNPQTATQHAADTVYEKATKDVLQGLLQLNHVLDKITDINKGNKEIPSSEEGSKTSTPDPT
jgi:hypothetical protein